MKKRTLLLFLVLPFTVFACTQSGDSCDDLVGIVTHSTIEITGIESTSLFRRVPVSNTPDSNFPDSATPDSAVLEAVDQTSGTEFSNLVIDLRLSWIEEQHRFRAPSTFIQSMLDWFVSPAIACSLAPLNDDYQPAVSRIDIYSDSDFNDDFPAGSNLTEVFRAIGELDENNFAFAGGADNDTFRSARNYRVEPLWRDGVLATTPVTPSMHIFTILITLDDGRAFEVRSDEILISAV